MYYECRTANETLGILYKLIEQRFAEIKKITITHSSDTMDLRFDIDVEENLE